MESKIFNLIIILYSFTTFIGMFILFIADKESIQNFKKWVLNKVNNNHILYVIAIAMLFMIYGVVFAWLAGCLLLISLLISMVVALILILKELIHKIYKMPQPENTNNMEIPVSEEV